MQIKQLHPRFAAEIIGLDTAAHPTREMVDAFEDAMAQYAVCVIRNASLNDEHHIRFSRAFGPLELPPSGGKRIAPELYDVGNLDPSGEIIAPNPNAPSQATDFERFHTDSPFNSLPTKWSFLLGHIVPPTGANTEFVDTRAVYEDLPTDMLERIAPLSADHDLFRALERKGVIFGDEQLRKAYPRMAHPLVRTSASGRKALYLGWHAVGICGWPQEEGEKLLDELFQFATQAKYIYSHVWRQGDLVVWDNRCTMHSATSFERFRYKRDVRRTTINEYGAEVSTIEGKGAAA